MSTAALLAILAGLVLIIASCAFGVVRQAEAIARRLPDPYGTLVLTLAIVLIEVVLISAVMLGPGQHATIARDSVMAVMMIILNLVVGLALLIAGTRHAAPRLNRVGMSVYLALLVVLLAIAFVFPALVGDNGSYTPGQAALIATLTTVLYAFFLFRQMGRQRHDFQEPHHLEETPRPSPGSELTMSQLLTKYRRELTGRTVLLVALVVPIVLLSHGLADVLDRLSPGNRHRSAGRVPKRTTAREQPVPWRGRLNRGSHHSRRAHHRLAHRSTRPPGGKPHQPRLPGHDHTAHSQHGIHVPCDSPARCRPCCAFCALHADGICLIASEQTTIGTRYLRGTACHEELLNPSPCAQSQPATGYGSHRCANTVPPRTTA